MAPMHCAISNAAGTDSTKKTYSSISSSLVDVVSLAGIPAPAPAFQLLDLISAVDRGGQ
jgi:hypothetical protein